MKTKRLLQINVTANWGSTGKIAEDIGLSAIEAGWDSYIAYGRYRLNSQSKLIQICNNKDTIIHGIYSRIFDKHGLSSTNSTKKFIKEIERIQPDVIHLHNIHGYYLNYKILFQYLAKTNIPIVWTFHDCWPFTGHCAHFDYIACEKWKHCCQSCPQKKSYPASWLADNSKHNYLLKKDLFTSVSNMTLVPVSEWLASKLEESFLNKYPIITIHNGINTDAFTPQNISEQKRKQFAKKKVILGVANVWSKRKGLEDFIELRKKLTDDYVILLIGLNKKQIDNLAEGIIGIERTKDIKELAEYYNIADVYFNPTYEDTFPTTNLESLSCGTPVITYKTGGSVEAIDKETGIIIEKGDIATLAEKIEDICDKPKETFLNKCRTRAVSLYNKNNNFKEYINLYDSLLTKP